MDDMSTGGHEANRDSVPLISCTDMGVSKDFEWIMKKHVWPLKIFGNSHSQRFGCHRTFFGNLNSQKKPKIFDLFGLFASRAKIVTQIYVCLLSAGCDVICGPCMPTFLNIKLLWNMYSCILAVYFLLYFEFWFSYFEVEAQDWHGLCMLTAHTPMSAYKMELLRKSS